METQTKRPETLQDAILHFSKLDAVQKFVTDWNRLVDAGAIKGGEASKFRLR